MTTEELTKKATLNVAERMKRECAYKYLEYVKQMKRRYDLMIKSAENGYESLGLHGIAYDKERVTGSTNHDALERGVIKMIEEQEDAASFIEAVAEGIAEAKSRVRMLDDMEEQYIIFAHYFHGVSYKEIASELNYVERTIFMKRNKALLHLYEYIPIEYKIDSEVNQAINNMLAD